MSKLSLDVEPGYRVGPFILGVPISEVIKILTYHDNKQEKKPGTPDYSVNKIEILYNQKEPLLSDIIVKLVDESVALRFEPKTQRLRIVEVNDITKVTLNHDGVNFSGPGIDCTYAKIYNEIFSKAHPGFLKDNIYHLYYEGLAFHFPIPEKFVDLYKGGKMPIELPNGTTPTATRMICFPRSSESNSIELPKIVGDGEYFPEVTISPRSGISINGKTVKCFMSPQDVLLEIGKPDRVFYKKHKKLRIAPPSSSQENVTQVDYIYNYFSKGFDVMFSGKTHQVEKIICHTNFPGSIDFNIYVKCNFKMEANQLLSKHDEEKSFIIGPDTNFTAIQTFLSSEPHSKPLVNDNTTANNPFGGTEFIAYRGVIFEVMGNDHLNSITIFSEQ